MNISRFILWCNENNGFTSALLSVIGLGVSIIALWVSIRTERLPYKKKVILQMNNVYGVYDIPGSYSYKPPLIALTASITNIGNRKITVEYLGFSIKENDKFWRVIPINSSEFKSNFVLAPSEVVKNRYDCDNLLISLSNCDPKNKLYVLAIDTEGKEYKKKIGTVNDFLSKFSHEK